MDVVQVITGFVLGLGIILPFFLKTKAVIKEAKEALMEIDEALEDNSISLAEAQSVLKELKDIIGVFKP